MFRDVQSKDRYSPARPGIGMALGPASSPSSPVRASQSVQQGHATLEPYKQGIHPVRTIVEGAVTKGNSIGSSSSLRDVRIGVTRCQPSEGAPNVGTFVLICCMAVGSCSRADICPVEGNPRYITHQVERTRRQSASLDLYRSGIAVVRKSDAEKIASSVGMTRERKVKEQSESHLVGSPDA